MSDLCSVALFEWAALNVGVVIATALWVGIRATGIPFAIHNDVVAVVCTSAYAAL
jgi:hypothetical protein